jgi:hypothetical protein
MPLFTFTQLVAAGGTYLPLNNWQFRQPARKAILEIMTNATAVGCVQNLTTGAESIIQAECPVQAGGAAGVIPARLAAEPAVDMVDPGDEIVLTVRNTTGGGVTVNGVAILTYKD